MGSHESTPNSVQQKKVWLFDPENGETTSKLAEQLIDSFKNDITFQKVTTPVQDDIPLPSPLAIIVRSTTPRFQDDFDEALEKTKGKGFNEPDIVIYLHKDDRLKSDETERCANHEAKYRDMKIIDMSFSKSESHEINGFVLNTTKQADRPSRTRLKDMVRRLYEKIGQAKKVCLYDPENGETTSHVLRTLSREFRGNITFQKVATPAEKIKQLPLAVLVSGTTRQYQDDFDEVLKKTNDAGFNDPDIMIYLDKKEDCSDKDEKSNYMDHSLKCTFYSKELVSRFSRNDRVHIVDCLYKQNEQSMKTLYVYTKTEDPESNKIIERLLGQLLGFMKGELQIEKCDSLKRGSPLAVICQEDDIYPGVKGTLLEKFKELGTTVNLVVLRLLHNKVKAYWKMEEATSPFEIIDIDISGNKEGRYFITHKICKFLIGFVKKCNLE